MSHSHLVLNMLYKIVYNSEMYGTNLSARANSPSMSSLSCSTAVLGSNFLLIMSAKVSSSQVKVQSAASSASYNFTFFKSNTVYMKKATTKNVSHLENRPFKKVSLTPCFLDSTTNGNFEFEDTCKFTFTRIDLLQTGKDFGNESI